MRQSLALLGVAKLREVKRPTPFFDVLYPALRNPNQPEALNCSFNGPGISSPQLAVGDLAQPEKLCERRSRQKTK